MGKDKLSGCRCPLRSRSVLQLQRRQGQVRYELVRQCQRELRFRVGFCSEVSPLHKEHPYGCSLYYREVLDDLIHPPSIRPISSIISWSVVYFLLSSDFVSFISRTKKRSVFSLMLAFSRIAVLLSLLEYPASRKYSMTSTIRFSLLS